MRRQISVKSVTALACSLALLMSAPGTAWAAQEQARSADSFVESIGVCTHWTYPDTPYGFAYADVKQKLLDSGIRHIRDGFGPRLVELGKAGIRVAVVADMDNNEDGGPATLQRILGRIKEVNAQGGAIDAIEGPNEPDFFWASFKKLSRAGGSGQREWHHSGRDRVSKRPV